MSKTLKALFSLALLTVFSGIPVAGGEASDPKAVELAERTVEAMGGHSAWDATRFFRFEFFGFRLHHWDRYTGRHRLEGKTRDGDAYLVLHNVLTREGRAWVNGEEQTGEDLEKWLQNAYEAWINDTYWLVMPYKLRDPGVTLKYDGSEEIEGTVYDKLLLSFDHVGVTPGDRYWAYLNRDTGLMDRWAYHLEDWEPEREATHWWWRDWRTYGRVKLSHLRVKADDGSERELGKLKVFDHLPDEVFTSVELPELP